MFQVKMLTYNKHSKSAKALAKALGIKRLKEGSSYVPTRHTLVLNWGCSSPSFTTLNVLNKPEAVRLAANKLLTFQKLEEARIPIPAYTTDRNVAGMWLEDGHRVFARQKLTGHTGEGIVVVEAHGELPSAPLYTRYQKKDREYRVHVFKGRVLDITEKRRRQGGEAHPYIRNTVSGWVFCRDGVVASDAIKNTSIAAVAVLGLDFGGVDIIERDGYVYVLEVNTASGIEGTTLLKYAEAFKQLMAPYERTRRTNVQTRRHRNNYR